MIDLAFVLILTAWAAVVGVAILSTFESRPAARTDRLALAVPIGLGTMALAALGLGEVGWLGRSGLLTVLLLGGAAGLWVNFHSGDKLFRRVGSAHFPETRRAEPYPRGLGLAFDAVLAVAILGSLLTALAPATDGDALCYHLQVPKVFLQAGGMTFEPDLHETIYPLVTEMLYVVALAFRGPIACRLLQWVLGLCFAGCVTALARPALGTRARWAGTIALLVPAVSNGMGAPMNDVALAAFANAGLVAVMLWVEQPTARRAAMAGIVAGLAIGVKYPALVWVGVLGVDMLARRRNPRSLAIFSLTALLVGGWWYLRAFFHTGNPVYPFFRDVFGGAGLVEVLDPIKRPMAVTLPNLLTALGPMTLQPDRFDSFSHQLGPAFLLFVPGLFLLKPPRRVVGIAGVGFAFLTLCLSQRQSMRFVLAAVGPFAVAVAWIASRWWDRGSLPGRMLAASLVAVLAFEAAIAAGHARHGLSAVFGRETEAAFLLRREPSYRVGEWIDANLPKTARVIGQEHRGFYLPRDYTMELAHRRRTGLGTRGESPETIVAQLRDRGFTHLLLCPPEPETAVEFDPTMTRRLAPWLNHQTPVYREAITDPDGVTRRYAIYDLRPAAIAETRTARR